MDDDTTKCKKKKTLQLADEKGMPKMPINIARCQREQVTGGMSASEGGWHRGTHDSTRGRHRPKL